MADIERQMNKGGKQPGENKGVYAFTNDNVMQLIFL